ncbi:recombinase family protein [Dyadobacter jiangsuensis]
MKNVSEITNLCEEFLRKLIDSETRHLVPNEVHKLITAPIDRELPNEEYTRYVFFKTLMEMYKVGLESCYKELESHRTSNKFTTPKTVYYRSKQKQSISADEFAMRIRPLIEQFRASGHTTLQQIADRLTELGIETPQGGKWYAKTVRKIELRIARIETEYKNAVDSLWP